MNHVAHAKEMREQPAPDVTGSAVKSAIIVMPAAWCLAPIAIAQALDVRPMATKDNVPIVTDNVKSSAVSVKRKAPSRVDNAKAQGR